MPNLIEIQTIIYDYIKDLLPLEFNKIYWQSERFIVPKKPYCMLTVLSETTDAPTSERQLPNSLTKQVTMYKTSVITIAVYVDGLNDYKERKEFAYNSLNKIRTQFETLKSHYKFKHKFSVLNLSGIRALNEPVNGGYLFRYEFDMTVGFNEVFDYNLPVSHSVKIDMEANNIHIEVTEEDIKDD